MTPAMVTPGNTASTFLTCFFSHGLEDEWYMFERLQAMADGRHRIMDDWAGYLAGGGRDPAAGLFR